MTDTQQLAEDIKRVIELERIANDTSVDALQRGMRCVELQRDGGINILDIVKRQQEVIRELVYGFEHIKTWHVPTNSCAASSLCEHIQTTLDNLTPLLEISNDK